jgi:catechol 2,3-dioxygenase-like lactoylglutathione lyase family enzyme
MKIQDVFALITTDKMAECRDFYVHHFGFEVAFETPVYLQLSVPAAQGSGFSLAFMPTSHPFGVVGPAPFNGQGLMLTLQVADSAAVYAKVKAENGNIIHDLKTEAWGQRRFTMRDPAGTAVDVVQSDGMEAEPGYFEQFAAKPAASQNHEAR